jgi:hypothetical protein
MSEYLIYNVGQMRPEKVEVLEDPDSILALIIGAVREQEGKDGPNNTERNVDK